MDAIVIKNLTKKYKNLTAVNELNLNILQGELFALLGVNGAGKTTTIKMLSGLVKVTSGDAYLEGNSIITNSKAVKQIIGISPQETAVAENLTVKENLKFICGIYGFDKLKTQQRMDEIVSQFGLQEVINQKASKLSGGYKRRVSIAMALISQPKILFLDEPTLGLDVIARQELWETISKLKNKITIILTTHYMEEAQSLADRVGVMKNGKLIKVGTTQELLDYTKEDSFEKAFIALVKEG